MNGAGARPVRALLPDSDLLPASFSHGSAVIPETAVPFAPASSTQPHVIPAVDPSHRQTSSSRPTSSGQPRLNTASGQSWLPGVPHARPTNAEAPRADTEHPATTIGNEDEFDEGSEDQAEEDQIDPAKPYEHLPF